MGLLLAQLFRAPDDLDLTVSDLAAGLTMVRNLQKQREDEAVQRTVRQHLLESQTDEGVGWVGAARPVLCFVARVRWGGMCHTVCMVVQGAAWAWSGHIQTSLRAECVLSSGT